MVDHFPSTTLQHFLAPEQSATLNMLWAGEKSAPMRRSGCAPYLTGFLEGPRQLPAPARRCRGMLRLCWATRRGSSSPCCERCKTAGGFSPAPGRGRSHPNPPAVPTHPTPGPHGLAPGDGSRRLPPGAGQAGGVGGCLPTGTPAPRMRSSPSDKMIVINKSLSTACWQGAPAPLGPGRATSGPMRAPCGFGPAQGGCGW